MGRYAQSFSKIITYFPKKGISEKQKLHIDCIKIGKLLLQKKVDFSDVGLGKTFYLDIFQNGRISKFA